MSWIMLAVGAILGTVAGWSIAAVRSPRALRADDAPPPAVAHALHEVRSQLADAERARAQAHGALQQQVNSMRLTTERLQHEAAALVDALRAPQIRGQWGELQLRRIVEAAGMLRHVDFDEQFSVTGDAGLVRPDLVVHVAGNRHIVVDSKVSAQAYLDAVGASDPLERQERLTAHARHLRQQIDRLSRSDYSSFVSGAVEFVVMFIPSESFLVTALEEDPSVWDYAFEKSIVMATPASLLALLKTIGHTWRQHTLTENAQQVLDAGKELHRRLSTVGGHLDQVSKRLGATVDAFNALSSSLDSRLAPQARRFAELQELSDPELAVTAIDAHPQPPVKAEFHGRLDA